MCTLGLAAYAKKEDKHLLEKMTKTTPFQNYTKDNTKRDTVPFHQDRKTLISRAMTSLCQVLNK